MRKIYTSIDIGSDTVKFVVGEEKDDKVYVLASHAIKSKGIRKGLIVDSNLAVNTIKDGIKIINEDLGIEIKKVLVNVPDYNVKFMYVTGKINVNGKIETEHINKVINHTGTKKISSKELRTKIDGVYFNPKWNEEYSSTYVGLEITDLFSYPIYKYIKRNTKDKAFLIFEDKIVGYPNYENKGIKIFPPNKK